MDEYTVNEDDLLDLTDVLEGLAVRARDLPGNGPEKYVAARLLVDAAAHVRGAANQMRKLSKI